MKIIGAAERTRELDEMREHPSVRAVLSLFPDAKIVDVRHTAAAMSTKKLDMPCTYCKRPTEDRSSLSGLAATRDHVKPRSKGGRVTVLACRLCNSLKRDMEMDDWEAFMRSYPRWWDNPKFRQIGDQRLEPDRRYSAWQDQAREERRRDAHALAMVPYAESMMIMRHGKDYWKAWKNRNEPPCDCCAKMPKAYDDPKAQAAFEAVYVKHPGMLRGAR